ncbi:MAG: hypothetical protein KA768_03645 [Desulfobulbus sp.]|nr:hypothetical protein [Desulfobulbus sp.]
MEKERKRVNLKNVEAYRLTRWLEEHAKEFDGLFYREVAELANAEKVLEREVTHNHIGSICRQMGIEWKKPLNPSAFSTASYNELLGRIEKVEEQLQKLMKLSRL